MSRSLTRNLMKPQTLVRSGWNADQIPVTFPELNRCQCYISLPAWFFPPGSGGPEVSQIGSLFFRRWHEIPLHNQLVDLIQNVNLLKCAWGNEPITWKLKNKKKEIKKTPQILMNTHAEVISLGGASHILLFFCYGICKGHPDVSPRTPGDLVSQHLALLIWGWARARRVQLTISLPSRSHIWAASASLLMLIRDSKQGPL